MISRFVLALLLWYHNPRRIVQQFERKARKLESAKKFHDQYMQAQMRAIKAAEARRDQAERDAAQAEAVATNLRKLLVK